MKQEPPPPVMPRPDRRSYPPDVDDVPRGEHEEPSGQRRHVVVMRGWPPRPAWITMVLAVLLLVGCGQPAPPAKPECPAPPPVDVRTAVLHCGPFEGQMCFQSVEEIPLSPADAGPREEP